MMIGLTISPLSDHAARHDESKVDRQRYIGLYGQA